MASQGIQTCKRFSTAPFRSAVFEETLTLEVLDALVEMLVALAVVRTGKQLGAHQTLVGSLSGVGLHVQLEIVWLGEGLATSLARVLGQSRICAHHLVVQASAAPTGWRHRVADERVVVDSCSGDLEQLVTISSVSLAAHQTRAERVSVARGRCWGSLRCTGQRQVPRGHDRLH